MHERDVARNLPVRSGGVWVWLEASSFDVAWLGVFAKRESCHGQMPGRPLAGLWEAFEGFWPLSRCLKTDGHDQTGAKALESPGNLDAPGGPGSCRPLKARNPTCVEALSFKIVKGLGRPLKPLRGP